jgi:hypothetical protein
MTIINLIKNLKDKILNIRDRKYKQRLLEEDLLNMQHLSIEIKANKEYFTPSEKAEIEAEFERLKKEIKKLRAELNE